MFFLMLFFLDVPSLIEAFLSRVLRYSGAYIKVAFTMVFVRVMMCVASNRAANTLRMPALHWS